MAFYFCWFIKFGLVSSVGVCGFRFDVGGCLLLLLVGMVARCCATASLRLGLCVVLCWLVVSDFRSVGLFWFVGWVAWLRVGVAGRLLFSCGLRFVTCVVVICEFVWCLIMLWLGCLHLHLWVVGCLVSLWL